MTPGRIAAVLTCHDLGRWLIEALDSVERQTRPADEIVVVDDGSTDVHTRQVLSRLERQGCLVVRGEGRGASAARNLGARLTSAEYIVCLDADDFFEPEYFQSAAARLDAEPRLDFVSCALRGFGAASYVWTPSLTTFVAAAATNAVPHASTMIRRRLWTELDGFDENVASFELLDFWTRAIEHGVRGEILEQPLLNYRVRTGSGYRRSIQAATYRARFDHLYARQRAAVERDARELIVAKEAFLLSQRHHRQSLEARVASLEAELDGVRRQIAGAAAALEARGQSRVEWGDLASREPLSANWGCDRGKPVDRYYIEGFIQRHQADVRGAVLEVKDPYYTQRFGGAAVVSSHVIDIDRANPRATIVADLRRAGAIPSGAFDCVILTQTLHVIDDMPAVLAECARILRPGGVLLLTAPHVSRVDPASGLDGDFWRLTQASARKLLADVFPLDAFDVTTYGNVKSCTAFLYGLSVDELTAADLDHHDEFFPLIVAIRAVKPLETADARWTSTARPAVRRTAHRAAILCYHRVAELAPDSHGLCTPPGEFRAQMTHLREHFTPIGLEDLVRAAASGRIPERAVAVTFDDGYLDALTVASPILAELGVPATFFVNSDRWDEPHERWWDVVERVLLSAAVPPMLDVDAGGDHLRVPTRTSNERAAALDAVNRAAWPLDAAAREQLAADIVRWSGAGAVPRATHRVLTGDEVRELGARPGHTIGAHTVHHLALTTQPLSVKRYEVLENKAALERLLAKPVHLFSYPYGEHDADVRAVVAAAGFRAAVTVQDGLVAAGGNRLLLPRYEITARDHGGFAVRMRQIFDQAAITAPEEPIRGV